MDGTLGRAPSGAPLNAYARPMPPSEERRRGSLGTRLLAALGQPRGLGVAVAAVGAIGIASSLTPALPQRLELVEDLVDPLVLHLAAGTTALIGIILMLLGRGLARRRRGAHVAALALLGVSAVLHVVKGLDIEEATLAAGVFVLLVRSRREFTVPMPAGRALVVVRVALILAVIDLGFGLAGLAIGAGRFRVPFKPGRALAEVVRRLGGANGAIHFHGVARLFPLTLAVLGFVSVGALLVIAFAPVRTRLGLGNERTRAQVQTMTNRADGDTLDPFALRAEKHYVFSPDGEAAVAYRYVAGVGLASGDPIGAPHAFPDALAAFLALCDERGWRPAVMGVRNDRLDLYLDAGLSAWYLGDEAIIDVKDFTLDGRAMRDVRQAVNRTYNSGIVTEFHYEGELGGDLRGQLLTIAERGRRGAPERGFSMALDGLLSGRDHDCVIVVARADDGRPFAFQRYIPCQAGRGLSLDAMRREEDIGPNGVNERLIVDTIEWARNRQIAEVSLNFAFCRALIDPPDTLDLGERAQAWVIQRLSPHFQIESLLRFNAKFRPRWVPRSIVYRSLGDLTPVGAAAARAEGFLPLGLPERRSPAERREHD